MRTMWPNPACRDWFRNETGNGAIGGLSQVFQHVGFPPFSVLEQGAERQNVRAYRKILRRCASNTRHDATYLDIRHRDAGDQLNLRLSFPESLVTIAHFRDLSRDPG